MAVSIFEELVEAGAVSIEAVVVFDSEEVGDVHDIITKPAIEAKKVIMGFILITAIVRDSGLFLLRHELFEIMWLKVGDIFEDTFIPCAESRR